MLICEPVSVPWVRVPVSPPFFVFLLCFVVLLFKKKDLQKRLKSLFRKHINADADRIQESSDKIKSLNKILLHFNSLMNDVESKFSREANETRRQAIRSGGKAGKTEALR